MDIGYEKIPARILQKARWMFHAFAEQDDITRFALTKGGVGATTAEPEDDPAPRVEFNKRKEGGRVIIYPVTNVDLLVEWDQALADLDGEAA